MEHSSRVGGNGVCTRRHSERRRKGRISSSCVTPCCNPVSTKNRETKRCNGREPISDANETSITKGGGSGWTLEGFVDKENEGVSANDPNFLGRSLAHMLSHCQKPGNEPVIDNSESIITPNELCAENGSLEVTEMAETADDLSMDSVFAGLDESVILEGINSVDVDLDISLLCDSAEDENSCEVSSLTLLDKSNSIPAGSFQDFDGFDESYKDFLVNQVPQMDASLFTATDHVFAEAAGLSQEGNTEKQEKAKAIVELNDPDEADSHWMEKLGPSYEYFMECSDAYLEALMAALKRSIKEFDDQ